MDSRDERCQNGRHRFTLGAKNGGLLPLVRITAVQKGLDERIRRVTVFDGHSHLLRAITSLAVLVHEEEAVGHNVEAVAARTRCKTAG